MSDTGTTSIVAELHYADPVAALNWLSEVFGFETRMIVKDESGKIVFSEIDIDGGTVAIVPENLNVMLLSLIHI